MIPTCNIIFTIALVNVTMFVFSDIHNELVTEWLSLLHERDCVLIQKIKQDNAALLNERLVALLQMLKEIGALNLNDSPASLTHSLCHLRKEVTLYLSSLSRGGGATDELRPASTDEATVGEKTNNEHAPTVSRTPTPNPDSASLKADRDQVRTPTASIRSTMSSRPKRIKLEGQLGHNNVKPSPLLHDITGETVTTRSPYVLRLRQRRSQSRSPARPTSAKAKVTPRSKFNDRLQNNLVLTKEKLKRTPGVKRSPGGTPQRANIRVLDVADPGDMLTLALRRKFHSVRKLYGSPSADSPTSRDTSLNISID